MYCSKDMTKMVTNPRSEIQFRSHWLTLLLIDITTVVGQAYVSFSVFSYKRWCNTRIPRAWISDRLHCSCTGLLKMSHYAWNQSENTSVCKKMCVNKFLQQQQVYLPTLFRYMCCQGFSFIILGQCSLGSQEKERSDIYFFVWQKQLKKQLKHSLCQLITVTCLMDNFLKRITVPLSHGTSCLKNCSKKTLGIGYNEALH